MIHRLKLHLPAGPSAEHRLPAHIRWQLGRDPGCDVQIDHPSVSRRHARLEGDAQHGWLLEDLGSKNGTRFGGQPVRQLQRLRIGDWFALGDVYAVIEDVPPDRHSAEISQAQIRRQTSQLWLTRLSEFERADATAAKAQPHSTSLDRTEQLMADLLRAVVEVAEAKR
ncbi:MAG: FHA domain-containing protein, partial [Xanthomonadales bacterium]|nr:FHA domain-containing protein [Xanthomonadales bacterium]